MKTFISTYKSLYKAMIAPEGELEDFQRWLEIATCASKAIENNFGDINLPRSVKYSLETSLGHLIGIQLELSNRIKQGGELINEENDSMRRTNSENLKRDRRG